VIIIFVQLRNLNVVHSILNVIDVNKIYDMFHGLILFWFENENVDYYEYVFIAFTNTVMMDVIFCIIQETGRINWSISMLICSTSAVWTLRFEARLVSQNLAK